MHARKFERSALVVVGLFGLTFGLSGCWVGGSSTAAQPVASGAPIMLFDRSGRDHAAFASPSGNISCGFDGPSGSSTGSVTCEIIVKDWQAPAKPADCNAPWGSGLVLNKTAALLCADDTVPHDANSVTLPYGTSMRFAPFVCSSQTSGVDCTNTTTGAGFALQRGRYELRNP